MPELDRSQFTREHHPEGCTCWVPCETCDLDNPYGGCTCLDPCSVHDEVEHNA